MTVTAISDRIRQSHPYAGQPAAPAVPNATLGQAGPSQSITITLEIALDGSGLPRGAARLLAAVRELALELGSEAVRVEAVGGEEPVPAVPAAGDGDRRVPATDGTLYVYPDSRTAVRDGTVVRLTRLEFDLLLCFCEHPGRLFRRAELLRRVWGYDQTGARTVDVHVRRLRAKTGVHRPLVTTVHGVGYRLDGRARVSVVRPG